MQYPCGLYFVRWRPTLENHEVASKSEELTESLRDDKLPWGAGLWKGQWERRQVTSKLRECRPVSIISESTQAVVHTIVEKICLLSILWISKIFSRMCIKNNGDGGGKERDEWGSANLYASVWPWPWPKATWTWMTSLWCLNSYFRLGADLESTWAIIASISSLLLKLSY